MQTLTVRGLAGALSGPLPVVEDLANQLLSAGYIVHINALEVRLLQGDGFDRVIWHDGAFSGAPVRGAL